MKKIFLNFESFQKLPQMGTFTICGSAVGQKIKVLPLLAACASASSCVDRVQILDAAEGNGAVLLRCTVYGSFFCRISAISATSRNTKSG